MKRLIFFTAFTFFFCQHPSYAEEVALAPLEKENAMSEIEKELLSLEDDLLHSEEITPPLQELLTEELLQTSEEFTQEPLPSILAEEIIPPLIEAKLAEFPLITIENTTDTLSQENETVLSSLKQETTLFPSLTTTAPITSNIKQTMQISFAQVFRGSPYIYSILFGLSLFAITISLYTLIRLHQQNFNPIAVSKEIQDRLLSNNFLGVMDYCRNSPNLLCKMVSNALTCRKQGTHAMLENMRAEGKRATVSAWQQLNLLQDIAVVAPMLGLLGTIIGLFYAFYDLNRSFDSISNLLDGLGISVGTTVAGIIVAILAMVLHSTAKFRLIRALVRVESEATSIAHLMDDKNY